MRTGITGTLIISTLAGVVIVMQGCAHEVDGAAADKKLFQEATTGNYTYYDGTPGITAPLGGSPHGDFRLRFNDVAFDELDTATGKLPVGGFFPPGSIIVKDVYEGTSVTLHAIMKKDPANPLAGSGWLWAEIGTDGTVVFSVAKKGDGCISCHSSPENRDLVRSFDLH